MKSEVALIRQITNWSAALSSPELIRGIGDDCAIYRPRSFEDLVFTTDFLIEDVHFLQSTPAAAIGHKALARGLSDIAAMGAVPRFCLLSLALAPWANQRWIRGFYRGFLKLAQQYKMPLAGGDLSHSAKVVCDVVVCGGVPRGKALRRDTARPGDRIYVSGPLGKHWQKNLRPVPRLEFGRQLIGKATACMDLSDGISLDLHRLCLASNLAAALDAIPIHRGSDLPQALHGGEDYELLFTMPPKSRAPRWAIRVGTMIEGQPGLVTLHGAVLPALGYDHGKQP